jgi:hypothetical protein
MCTSKSEKGYSLCFLFAQKQNQPHFQALKLAIAHAFVLALIYIFAFQSMAASRENSPGHESVVIDNDKGIIIENNRTITHIRSNVVSPKNNERALIGNKSLI